MELGFSKQDITPRVGVELCGFGPFLNRCSTSVHDRLWARAMAVRSGETTVVIVSCDLIGVTQIITDRVRALLASSHGLAAESVMICCSHTHSGPGIGAYIGWGEADPPYLATLPNRIAAAADQALANVQPGTLHHAEVPCEGIGINREYEAFWADHDAAMAPGWRPDKPELTDTTCHVLTARTADDCLAGFVAYFGCHPVVCCQNTRAIHGDYPGVALNRIEQDHPGAVGLFLQGAQGDVNSAVGCSSQAEGLAALDVLAGRFGDAVSQGISAATPVDSAGLFAARRHVAFSRKIWSRDELCRRLAECERLIDLEDADGGWDDASHARRINLVYATALRRLLKRQEQGDTLTPQLELHGCRLGPIVLLGSPFETFQATKREVVDASPAPIPLVTGFVNNSVGYAPDVTCAARGGYAADQVPLICGELPFANIHAELVREFQALDAELEARHHDHGESRDGESRDGESRDRQSMRI